MSMLVDDIAEAQARLNVSERDVRRIPASEAEPIIEQVKACFLADSTLSSRRWWEHHSRRAMAVLFRGFPLFQVHHLVPSPDSLSWLITNMELVSTDEPIAVYSGTSPAIERVLGECRGLNEFYRVGYDLSWLLCLTHHGLISVMGYPALRRLKKLLVQEPDLVHEMYVWPAAASRNR